MQSLAHRRLRNESAEVLRRVQAGQSFRITNHGQAVALLIPVPDEPLEQLRAAGATIPATGCDFTALERVDSLTSREVLDDLRGDR
ncbi:type II toxin-antitoxin system Phd/YefM family antitoxin [Actinomyces slackii]|nr:type II toxin-antitoxin system prevent-host-death family antitoxin [Actinomyces slackii]